MVSQANVAVSPGLTGLGVIVKENIVGETTVGLMGSVELMSSVDFSAVSREHLVDMIKTNANPRAITTRMYATNEPLVF
ncbi:MAG: hypothetical protein AB8I69_21180 [Anaerolineae bacterium]